ncbi:MAG: response regulator [Xanthobacteraceae bacterium]|uniref:response regulator n=1 Tax=Pseudolabrys sp. TaxID=1960880 RepID=UPI003D0B9F6E
MPRILIIDDDNFVCEATGILLRANGYDVATASSGKAGIALIRAEPVDLAIVDLFMPDMDGIKVVETIREINPDLPLILASGFMLGQSSSPQMPGFEAMASEAGAVRTLCKPLRPKEVIEAVTEALANRDAAAAPAADADKVVRIG